MPGMQLVGLEGSKDQTRTRWREVVVNRGSRGMEELTTMNLTKLSRNGDTSVWRILLFLLAVSSLVVACHCGTVNLGEEQYNLTLTACRDEMAAWSDDDSTTAAATAEGEAQTQAVGRNDSAGDLSNGVFMRGTWKRTAASHQRFGRRGAGVVRPPFVAGDRGMFDFFSSQWTAVTENVNGAESMPTIQNISGQLFFRDDKDHASHRPGSILEASGVVYNGKVRKICFVACVQRPLTLTVLPSASSLSPNDSVNVTEDDGADDHFTPFNEDNARECSIRGVLTVSRRRRSKGRRNSAEGKLESLKNASETGYFTSVGLVGSIIDNKDQKTLYHVDILVRSSIYAIEAVIVIWQIVHTIRSSQQSSQQSSHFVSLLMILIQITVLCFLDVQLIYLPVRLLTYQRFKYLISTVALVPWLFFTSVILLNLLFFIVVYKQRRPGTVLNSGELRRELAMAGVCVSLYAATGFDSEVVWCWFLLPQVLSNILWDLRMKKPLHWIYITGLSLCRIVYIGFNALRPTIYGYDDWNLFPHSWFWGITGTVLFFSSYALMQQRYGGRCFLPQGWFGYMQLPSSLKNQADEDGGKAEDWMLDL